MKLSQTMKLFVKEFKAIIEGDNAEAQALASLRQADSALSTQIAALEGEQVDREEAVTEAKQALNVARVNGGKKIDSKELRAQYVLNLLNAKNALTEAEEALEAHNAKLVFLKEQKEEISKEVDA